MLALLPPRTARARPASARSGRLQHLLGATLLGPSLVAGGTLAGLALLQAVDPNEPGHYPTCPFLLLTGLWCPGCGSMRMLHHLGSGDLADAFWMNPLAFLLLPVLAGYWLGWVRRVATGRPRGAPLAPAVVWLFLVVTVAFGVLRNLPGLAALAPG